MKPPVCWFVDFSRKDSEEYFSLEEYRSTQERSTKWMADRSKRMVEFLQSRVEKGTRAWDRASLTAKSYLLQEAESTSRLAKLEWCKEERIPVLSLQHDGVMIGIGAERHEEARRGMSKSATEASGYNVEVVVKGIKEKNRGGGREGGVGHARTQSNANDREEEGRT